MTLAHSLPQCCNQGEVQSAILLVSETGFQVHPAAPAGLHLRDHSSSPALGEGLSAGRLTAWHLASLRARDEKEERERKSVPWGTEVSPQGDSILGKREETGAWVPRPASLRVILEATSHDIPF